MAEKGKNIKKVPNLRFPGFEGEWEERKLGDATLKINSGKTPLGGEAIYVSKGVLFIRSQNINNNRLELERPVFISEEINNGMKNSIVEPNDILLNITGASLGRSCVVPDDFVIGNVNQHVCIIRLNKDNNPRFVQPILASHKGQNVFISLQTGSGREGLNFESIKKIHIFFPSLKEQNRIASFLSIIDERIRTQSKIIEALNSSISGLQKRIFTQKLRFKDEKGKGFPKWEKKRLDEIISDFIVPMRDKPKELTGEIPWCRIEDFDGKYLTSSKSGQGVSMVTVKEMNLKIYPVNTLLVSCSANLGFCAIVKKQLITNQTFIGLVPDAGKVNIEFLYYAMKLSAKKLNVLSSGTTISYLSREQFEKFNINRPTYQEQTKIANYLSALDKKIELETNILKRLIQQKQYLLQNLFI